MSTVDLIILGIVRQEPVNAYELVNVLKMQNITRWVKISPQGVYRNITILEKKGYLKGSRIKEGNMPEKTVYTMTDKGEEYFYHMMHAISMDMGNFYMDFNAVIANLNNLNSNEANKLLENLKNQFYQKREQIRYAYENRKNLPYQAKMIIQLYYDIFDKVFISWIEKFIREYKGN